MDGVWYQSNDLDEELADSELRWAGLDLAPGRCTECGAVLPAGDVAAGETVCWDCCPVEVLISTSPADPLAAAITLRWTGP